MFEKRENPSVAKMISKEENLISLKEASKMTPYSSEYLGLLVRKGRIGGCKRGGKWFTTKRDIENYLKKVAESSYRHQETLNVKVPAAEIKKASVSFKWALLLMIVIIGGSLAILLILGSNRKEVITSEYEIVRDENNNLIIYVDDPNDFGSVKIMRKERE